MKKTNGSLHFTPSESCTLCSLSSRLQHSSDLLPAELDLVKRILTTYLDYKI